MGVYNKDVLPDIPQALVVDDDPGNLEVLNIFLSQLGYQPVTAATGREGLEKVRLGYVFAFIDLRLPDLWGIEVIEALRCAAPDTVIVAATMEDLPENVHGAFAAGADVFLVKPFDIAQIMQVLADGTRGKRWYVDARGMREYKR